MRHLLCCWELGEGYGHLFRLRGLIDQLPADVIHVSLASVDLTRAAELFPETELIQAPFCCGPARAFPQSVNYAQNLLRAGYWSADALRGVLRAWLTLFERFRPDALLVDHSPGALLAARIAGLRCFAVGSGWSLPPLVSPMPTLQPWFPIPEGKLLEHEAELLAAMNCALGEFAARPLDSLPELFSGCERLLTFHAELDHYERDDAEPRRGPVSASAAAPPGVAAPEAEIFVYVDREYSHLDRLAAALRERGRPVLASIRGATAEFCSGLSGGGLLARPGPLDIGRVLESCSLVICHGGVGLSGAALLAGKALLTLPQHLEQGLLGYRLGRRGLAASVGMYEREPDFPARIDKLLADESLLAGVARFRNERGGRSAASAALAAADRILGSLSVADAGRPC